MSQTLLGIQPYWSLQSSLTALVPAASVWIDVSADGAVLPYVILHENKQDYEWNFTGSFLRKTTFTIQAFASTLASVDAITTAVIAAFKWQTVTASGLFCRQVDQTEMAEQGGAYSATTKWELWEQG